MRQGSNKIKGFTAVEIAMVASVIAIIALLILPIFRQRAEEARVVAAQDELASLVKALLLIEADMPGGNFLPQLSDLDNRENTELTVSDDQTLEPATTRWNRDLGVFEHVTSLVNNNYFQSIVPNWRGPYAALRKTELLGRFPTSPLIVTTNRPGFFGPILVPTDGSLNNDRYPMDPWGNPYLLFGPEETTYNIRVIYSLGPNGVPGPPAANPTRPTVNADYNRKAGILGDGDDLSFEF